MSDLLAEVDEAMRQEKLEKFWKENGPFIIAFVVLTILMTGVISGYRSWDTSIKTKQTSELIEFMSAPNYPGNIVAKETLNFRAPLRAVALMGAAGTLMAQDKVDDAYTLYTRVAQDTKIKDDFRHLAILMSVRIDMDKDDADSDALLASLAPVLKNKSPYQPHARIDAALIHASLKNDYAAANELLNAVLDTKALPPTLYERAQNLHHVYSLKAQSAEKDTTQ